MKVFISSVMKELKKERESAREAILQLNQEPYLKLLKCYIEDNEVLEPIMFETFGSKTSSSREAYLEGVKKCDIYIGIIGKKYGSKSGNGISPTHEEYREADKKKKGINEKEILIYIKNVKKSEIEKEVKDFIKEIESKHIYSFFENEKELKDKIKNDILKIIIKRNELKKDIIKRNSSNLIEEIIRADKQHDTSTVQNKLNDLISIIKKETDEYRIENINFIIEEFILRFYKTYINLYYVIKDAIDLGSKYSDKIPFSIVNSIQNIMMFNWLHQYDIELAEKCSDVLLRISLDNLDKNIKLSESCFYSLDNLAGDMFEEVIFSRIILLGAALDNNESKNREAEKIITTIVDYIKWNDEYSHDADRYDYLISSIKYAQRIQDLYEIDISSFNKKYLVKIIEEIKNKTIREFIDFIEDTLNDKLSEEKNDEFDIVFSGEFLENIISSYKTLYPDIQKDVIIKLNEKNNKDIFNYFNKIVDSSNYLKHIFRGEDMITSINEFIQFIDKNSQYEEGKAGIYLWGDTFVYFKYNLNEKEEQELRSLAYKYGISNPDDFELNGDMMTFMMDTIIYQQGKEGVKKLIQFLEELNKNFEVKSISSGIHIEFK